MTKSDRLIYVSSSGVLLLMNDKKILIDGLCNSDIAMYKSTPPQIYQQIIQGESPFDKIDLMLITHHHSDHFSAEWTCTLLHQNPKMAVVSTSEVISSIQRKLSNFSDLNLIALIPTLHGIQEVSAAGINIEAISMTHFGTEYKQVNNFAYLIRDTISILHVGDADAIRENFQGQNLAEKNIDLLVAPFPYIGLSAAQQIVKEDINPKRIAIVHLPQKELDSGGWITATKKNYDRIKENYVPTEILEELGSELYL